MGDRIELPLDLDDVEVLGSEVVRGVVEVTVRSTLAAACRSCGSTDVSGHGVNRRRLHDVPCGRPVVLVWLQRRVRCRDCGRCCREGHRMVAPRKQATARLRRRLFERACSQPFAEVAIDHGVTAWRVVDAFDEHAEAELATRVIDDLRVVALDESSISRPFGYGTVLFDPIRRRPLEMVPGRQRDAAQQLLTSVDASVLATIETVVMDLWTPFRSAVRDVFGDDIRIVADRFHVQRVVDRAAHKVRTRLSRREPRIRTNGTPVSRVTERRYDPTAYSARFAFSTRHNRLSEPRRVQLAQLFADYPKIWVAWLMKEAFAAIFEAADRADAELRLATWVHNLDAAGLPELHTAWRRALRPWINEILAYFDDRQTNGYAEGCTNRIKVMKRRGYGYSNFKRYRARVLLSGTPRAA